MDAMKVIVFAAALLAIGAVRAGTTEDRSTSPLETCQQTGTIQIKNQASDQIITIQKPVNECVCIENGKQAYYPNGTNCLTLSKGHDDELTQKSGTCQRGKCVVTPIPRGCFGNPGIEEKVEPQVGCTFICRNKEGKQEFGYYPNGTVCRHYTTSTTYIETTCKKVDLTGKTMCQTEVPQLPAC